MKWLYETSPDNNALAVGAFLGAGKKNKKKMSDFIRNETERYSLYEEREREREVKKNSKTMKSYKLHDAHCPPLLFQLGHL